MKVEINEKGIMTIAPENKKDDEALHKWYSTYGGRVCKAVIIFERSEL